MNLMKVPWGSQHWCNSRVVMWHAGSSGRTNRDKENLSKSLWHLRWDRLGAAVKIARMSLLAFSILTLDLESSKGP
jgi:hypothetical protein